YTKAIAASKICLGLMRETQLGSSDGDLTAMRTYEIPAVGTFMLHERNSEVAEMLREDVDCGMFGSTDELVDKVQYYLAHETERRRIAESGRARIRRDGHSYDDRVRHILAYFEKCRTLKSGVERP